MFLIPLYSFPLLLAWCPLACGHLQANCSSDMTVSNVQSGVREITGTIFSNSCLQLSCSLKLDKPGSFLRMKTKRNDKKKGEGITSLIEWSYLLLEERRFVDFWLKWRYKTFLSILISFPDYSSVIRKCFWHFRKWQLPSIQDFAAFPEAINRLLE